MGLIIVGEYSLEELLMKSMIGLNMGNIIGNLIKKREETRYMRVSQKIINVNFPIFP